MVKAVRIHEFGGPDVIRIEDVEVPAPGAGEVVLDQKAIALHFADTMLREGRYHVKPELPATIGLEAIGVIEAVGPGVDGWAPGDRAAYMFNPGAACEKRIVEVEKLVRVPEGIDDNAIAGGFLRGMTAQYLLKQCYAVQPGDDVVVHAAAGGMGSILSQWAKHLGARVIGTAGGAEKVALAKTFGCDEVIDYRTEDFADRVEEITGGKGVEVVYDAIGKDVYAGNLRALAPTGALVNYGHASGLLPPLDAMELNKKSLSFQKASLPHFTRTPERFKAMADDVFAAMTEGVFTVHVTREYALDEIETAHRDIAERRTTGSVVIVP